MEPLPSPGNAYMPELPPMSFPYMDFIYRLACTMSPHEQIVGKPCSSHQSRIILPIAGGSFSGPKIAGTIVDASGADWATSLPDESFMKLDARYTLKTNDGFYVYVRSKGIYQPEPSQKSPGVSPPTNITQSQAEWFTRLQFEACVGPYEWMNYVFAIGVLTMHEGKIVIDAYRLTNFPGREPFPPTA